MSTIAVEQCSKAARKARSVLAMVIRNYKRPDEQDSLLIYKSYKPGMEYCVKAWSPHLAKDIQTLEKVQRCATKLAPSIKMLSYEIRLKKLKGMENIDQKQFFEFSETGHNLSGYEASSQQKPAGHKKVFLQQ